MGSSLHYITIITVLINPITICKSRIKRLIISMEKSVYLEVIIDKEVENLTLKKIILTIKFHQEIEITFKKQMVIIQKEQMTIMEMR